MNVVREWVDAYRARRPRMERPPGFAGAIAGPKRRSSGRRGMSLVEVMVVIAIILTLMSILMIGVFRIFGNSQVETTRLTITKVNQAVEIHMLRKKKPPTTAEGLAAAFEGDKVPKDAWNNDFIYVSPGPDGTPYDVVSLGSDGQEGGTGNAEDIKWSSIQKE